MLSLPLQIPNINESACGWRPEILIQRVAGTTAVDIEKILQLRSLATTAYPSEQMSIYHMVEYASQLMVIAPKLEGYEAEVRFEFSWSSFSTSVQLVSSSVYFDFACILWNIAATYANLGALQDRVSSNGINISIDSFEKAAGTLSVLLEFVLPKIRGEVFPHLSEAGVGFALNLMLAQAQCMHYLLAVEGNDNSPDALSTLASLAAQISLFYMRAYSFSMHKPVATVLDESWWSILLYNLKCFQAYTEIHEAAAVKVRSEQSQVVIDVGHGEEISRLNRAMKTLRKVIMMVEYLPPRLHVLLEEPTRVIKHVELELATAYQEYNSQLHIIVNSDSLVPVEGVSVIEILDVIRPVEEGEALFQSVVSREVMDAVNSFQCKVRSIISDATTPANHATNLARGTLSDYGLPGTLETFHAGGSLSDKLCQKIEDIQKQGGVSGLKSLYKTVDEKAIDVISCIEDIFLVLESEKIRDADFAKDHPGWDGIASVPNLHVLTDALLCYRDKYYNARMRDGILSTYMDSDEFLTSTQIVSLSRKELISMIPAVSTMSWSVWSSNILDAALKNLESLISERTIAIEMLNNLSSPDLAAAIAKLLSAEEEIDTFISLLLNPYEQLAKVVIDLTNRQPSLLDAVMHANVAFTEARNSDNSAVEMNRAVSCIEQAVMLYRGVESQLAEATAVHVALHELVSSLWGGVYKICTDLDRARKEHEKSVNELADFELVKQMEAQWNLSNKMATKVRPTFQLSKLGRQDSLLQAKTTRKVVVPPASCAPGYSPPSLAKMKAKVTEASQRSLETSFPTDSAFLGKVVRLVGMGFPKEDVTKQLRKHNYDERLALNALLGL